MSLLLMRRRSILRDAVFACRAYGSNGVLTDLSGKGHAIQHGSAAGADGNDPLWLPYDGINHLYFPGTAGNSLTVPNAGTVNTGYTITYKDGSTDTGSSSANPLTFGGTDAKFAGLKVKSIVFTSGLTGSWLAASATDPYTSYSDGTNTWTYNRTATGLKLTFVERDKYLLGTDDYFEIADADDLDFALTDSFTVCWLGTIYGAIAGQALVSKKTDANLATVGWELDRGGDGLTPRFRISDGSFLPSATGGAITPGRLTLISAVRNSQADTLQAFNEVTGGTPVTDTTTGTLANSVVMRLGAYAGGTPFLDGAKVGVAIFRRALSTAEFPRVKNALLGLSGY